jgi:hypothetical protein
MLSWMYIKAFIMYKSFCFDLQFSIFEVLIFVNYFINVIGAHGGGEGCIQHFGWEA